MRASAVTSRRPPSQARTRYEEYTEADRTFYWTLVQSAVWTFSPAKATDVDGAIVCFRPRLAQSKCGATWKVGLSSGRERRRS
jgi:hypothetical protein